MSRNSWFWWDVNGQPMSTAVPQSYFLPFDSFWSSPMGSIYLRKWKLHKNVICLKSFKLGFSSTWTKNFQIYKLGFEEAEEPEDKLLTSYGSWRKQGSFRKTSASLTTLKFLTVQFSCSGMSDSLGPHQLQHARPPCPSPTPGVHSNSRPSSPWCHPAISSPVIPFSSCPNPSQHQSLFQWVNSLHEVAKVLEFQLQQHSFQRTSRTDLL